MIDNQGAQAHTVRGNTDQTLHMQTHSAEVLLLSHTLDDITLPSAPLSL